MMMTEQNTFKRYDSPEQYAEAFLQMIDARERWRELVAHVNFITATRVKDPAEFTLPKYRKI